MFRSLDDFDIIKELHKAKLTVVYAARCVRVGQRGGGGGEGAEGVGYKGLGYRSGSVTSELHKAKLTVVYAARWGWESWAGDLCRGWCMQPGG